MELELPRLLAPDLPSNWFRKTLYFLLIPSRYAYAHRELFVVTTSSICWNWVIYAPAAFLGSGSHLESSLSDVEPQFLVIRYNLGSPRYYQLVDRSDILIDYLLNIAILQLSWYPLSLWISFLFTPLKWCKGLNVSLHPRSSQVLSLSFTKLSLYLLIEETITVLMSRSQFHPSWTLYLHMHGLIFNISI